MDTSEIVAWSGHVTVIKDAQGKAFLRYQSDTAAAPTDYHPSGFFETKAINGLVSKLVNS